MNMKAVSEVYILELLFSCSCLVMYDTVNCSSLSLPSGATEAGVSFDQRLKLNTTNKKQVLKKSNNKKHTHTVRTSDSSPPLGQVYEVVYDVFDFSVPQDYLNFSENRHSVTKVKTCLQTHEN